MPYSVLARNDQLALWDFLSALTDHEITDKNAAPVLNVLGGFVVHAIAFSSGPVPAFMVLEAENQIVVVIAGASNATMFLSMFQGSTVPGVALGRARVNSALLFPLATLVKWLPILTLKDARDICIVGHSYGGSLAHCLAAYLIQSYQGPTVQVLTGGAPRTGDLGLSAVLSPLPVVRLMTPADPLVRFPPHYEEAPFASVALPYLVPYNWSFFVQPGGGYVIDQTGVETPAVLPPDAGPVLDVDLSTWLIGANGAASQQHSYRTYRAYLAAGALQELPPVPDPQMAGIKGETVFVPSAEVIKAGPVEGPKIFLKERQTVQSVYIPPQFKFNVVRVGNQWQVFWMERAVVIGQTKSNAKTFAKAGNKMLRVMQSTQEAKSTNWRDSFAAYLTVASSATSGVMPPLNVT